MLRGPGPIRPGGSAYAARLDDVLCAVFRSFGEPKDRGLAGVTRHPDEAWMEQMARNGVLPQLEMERAFVR
jgi:hypothetical protein